MRFTVGVRIIPVDRFNILQSRRNCTWRKSRLMIDLRKWMGSLRQKKKGNIGGKKIK